jgi:ABC-type polysaccharide transport system permease subunit
MCLHECMHYIQTCVSNAVDSMVACFNAYAFTYIGMYNYGFLEAGANATELFERRGWTTIVSDDLVPNVLFLTSLVIGGITGCFAHFISKIENMSIASLEDSGVASFVVGVVIGLVLTSVVFSVVSSSVNTVLVCVASSPVDFERNHP